MHWIFHQLPKPLHNLSPTVYSCRCIKIRYSRFVRADSQPRAQIDKGNQKIETLQQGILDYTLTDNE